MSINKVISKFVIRISDFLSNRQVIDLPTACHFTGVALVRSVYLVFGPLKYERDHFVDDEQNYRNCSITRSPDGQIL